MKQWNYLEVLKVIQKKMKMVKMFLIWFTKVVLVHCNIVNNNYQQKLRVLYTFLPKKSFGQILVDPPEKKENYIFKNVWLKIFIYLSMAYR